MVISLFILPLTLLVDSKIRWTWFGMDWPMALTFIYMVFVFFRRDFREAIFSIFYCAILSHAFTSLSFSQILAPYLLIFAVITFLNTRIITETYLYHAFWVFSLLFVFIAFQLITVEENFFNLFLTHNGIFIVLYCLLNALASVVFFMVFDRIFDSIFKPKKSYL